jgi:hypothetical protein
MAIGAMAGSVIVVNEFSYSKVLGGGAIEGEQ